MKKYSVGLSETFDWRFEVEANSKEEAENKAYELAANSEGESGGIEIYECDEVIE